MRAAVASCRLHICSQPPSSIVLCMHVQISLHHFRLLLASQPQVVTAGMAFLQEALADKQACHPNQPLRAPMPSHWTDMSQNAQVAYVELPLPPGCSPDPNAPAATTPPPLDEEILQAMMQQVWGHSYSSHFVTEICTKLLLLC